MKITGKYKIVELGKLTPGQFIFCFFTLKVCIITNQTDALGDVEVTDIEDGSKFTMETSAKVLPVNLTITSEYDFAELLIEIGK